MALLLTYLTTGEQQHVFTRPDDPQWVYKVPSAFGYFLPFDHRCSRFGRQAGPTRPRPLDRPLYLVLCRLPQMASRAIDVRLRAHLESRRVGWLLSSLKPAQLLADTAGAIGQRIVVAYARREQQRCFHYMLDMFGRLHASGVENTLLPMRWRRRVRATLCLDGRRSPYTGPWLQQRRADVFLSGNAADYESFDWHRLVELEHNLWRSGVAFATPHVAVGPVGWALLGGELRLADTGALTDDLQRARKALRPEYVNTRISINLRRLNGRAAVRAVEYYDFIRERMSGVVNVMPSYSRYASNSCFNDGGGRPVVVVTCK
jgi:hypothetical protein